MGCSLNQIWKTVPRPSTCTGMPCRGGQVAQALGEPVAERPLALVEARLGEHVHGRRHRGALHDVGVVGARVRVAAVGDHAHDRARAADGGHREAAAEALGQGREVGHDAVPLLGAAAAEAEAGDDLVEDEQRAVLARLGAQQLEVAGLAAGCSRC